MTRPTEVLTTALATTRRVLFEPFDASKYLAIGFCVWLARLGSAGGHAASRGGSSGNAATPEFDPTAWRDALEPALALGWLFGVGLAVGLALLVALIALVLFLQSRGTFLVIDAVSKNRGAVVEPWATTRPEGTALFRFRLGLTLGALAAALVLVGGAAGGVLATSSGDALSIPQIALLSSAGFVATLMAIGVALADALAVEFVAPLMYARRSTVREGFADLSAFVRREPTGFVVYALLRIVASLVVSALTGALACLTCGLVLVPFLGTLIVLPALLYLRVMSMHFVAQWADDLPATLAPG